MRARTRRRRNRSARDCWGCGWRAWYHGVLHKKDYIGDAKREIELEDIPRAGRLMYLTAVLALVVFGVGKALLIVL